jgi:hypothetical protein
MAENSLLVESIDVLKPCSSASVGSIQSIRMRDRASACAGVISAVAHDPVVEIDRRTMQSGADAETGVGRGADGGHPGEGGAIRLTT